VTAEDASRLEEIRARDKARGYGHAGVTMTQSEADRRTLLRMLDAATADVEIWHEAHGDAARAASRQAEAAQDAAWGVADAWAFLATLRAVLATNGRLRRSLLDESAPAAGWAAAWQAADETVAQAVQDEPEAGGARTFQWGESVTWTGGGILVHLNLLGIDAADLELDRDDAEILGTMLLDAAGHGEDSTGELRAEELDDLTEQYLRHLRGQGAEPDLSSLPDGCRAKVEGQFATIRTLRALADRGPELPPLDQDPVAIRLGLVGKNGE
jgi:hypothetical protein